MLQDNRNKGQVASGPSDSSVTSAFLVGAQPCSGLDFSQSQCSMLDSSHLYVCMHVCGCACHRTSVEVGEPLCGASPVLPPLHGLQGLNSGLQTWVASTFTHCTIRQSWT